MMEDVEQDRAWVTIVHDKSYLDSLLKISESLEGVFSRIYH